MKGSRLNNLLTMQTLISGFSLLISIQGLAESESSMFDWRSKGGDFTLKTTADVMVDASRFDFEEINGDDDQGLELRRARLGLRGKIYSDWHYKLQLEFSDDDGEFSAKADVKDASIKYRGWPVEFVIGRFKVPFGMERLTSLRSIPTIERSVFWDFVPSGRSDFNIQAQQSNKRFSWVAGVYENDNGLIDGIEDVEHDSTVSYALRGTWLAHKSQSSLVHIGASAMTHDLGENRFNGRLKSRFGARMATQQVLVDADSWGKEAAQWGVETAWVKGPCSLQGEYVDYRVDSDASSVADVVFEGFYVQGSWSLTGESRTYENNHLANVHPAGSSGAWELVSKYEFGKVEYDHSVEYDLLTMGLNWYFRERARISVNYQVGNYDNGLDSDGEYSAVISRLQLRF